ncbi:universal stress protein [Halobellus clavatus]|jgi:nucleotide-binding universal stress UspA family protein|uniref:Nucleotide-binding universal stress protein, UspA family n=1 Tax=Halobellus clavatus TaxID=660517 RepID=A0A1H3HRK3_9EURY|nr:universal stress protein [Halobellus clavatus]SDY17875.1 Nucleotide-binding universal stress protein, UspA family [Halobellus clavatus]
MYDHVLVPTDGSEGTREALDHALDIAATRDATIHALSVVDRRLYLAAGEDQKSELRTSLEEDAHDAVERVATAADDAGVDSETIVRDGTPYRAILDYAEESAVDLIVMGTHGRSGRDKLQNLGSVTERVVENTDIPILVVRMSGE